LNFPSRNSDSVVRSSPYPQLPHQPISRLLVDENSLILSEQDENTYLRHCRTGRTARGMVRLPQWIAFTPTSRGRELPVRCGTVRRVGLSAWSRIWVSTITGEIDSEELLQRAMPRSTAPRAAVVTASRPFPLGWTGTQFGKWTLLHRRQNPVVPATRRSYGQLA
jgi:hypothetical protein